MDRPDYDAFTEELLARTQVDDRVIGLVALGSMADQDYGPDRWSDHDFFVIARNGEERGLREDLAWLPRHDRIVFALRETEHGWKVLFAEGHLIEFAVFSPSEIVIAKAGRFRVLLDRGGVEEMMTSISGEAQPNGSIDLRHEIGTMVTNLLVGVGRANRGELLSGYEFVAGAALQHLLRALSTLPSADAGLLDGLNPNRRFERVYPATGSTVHALMGRPLPEMALGMLAIARDAFDGQLPNDLIRAFDLVERHIAAS